MVKRTFPDLQFQFKTTGRTVGDIRVVAEMSPRQLKDAYDASPEAHDYLGEGYALVPLPLTVPR